MLIPYYSFSTKGYLKDPDEYFINLHKASAFLCKKAYGQVNLLTDSKGYKFFKNKVKFDSIEVLKELDNIPDAYRQVWSMGKLICFKHLADNNIPFLHVDYDVFLWKKLPDFIENADVFVQNKEYNAIDHYKVDIAYKYCRFKNFEVPKKNFLQKLFNLKDNIYPNYAYNMGIFGGQDLNFIKKYATNSLEFVLHPDNAEYWTKIPILNSFLQSIYWSKATIAEQWYLAKCEEIFNKKITCLFNEEESNSGHWSDVNFEDNEYNLIDKDIEKRYLLNKLLTEKNIIENKQEQACHKYGYTHLWGAKTSEPIKAMVQDLVEKYDL